LLYKVFEAEDGIIPSTLEDYTGLIIMGGPMGVYEMDIYPHLKIVSRLIREAINRDLKVLGICLGSQLIAHTLGAKVYQGHVEEIGWQDIELTGDGLRDPLMIALAKHPSVGDVWKNSEYSIGIGILLIYHMVAHILPNPSFMKIRLLNMEKKFMPCNFILR